MKLLLIACMLLTWSLDANAVQAYLVECHGTTSVTGRWIYVGTYRFYGPNGQQTVEQAFNSWCPYNIEIY